LAYTSESEILQQQEGALPREFATTIGSRQAPYDARAKLTGRAKFGEDTYLPNMLHGKILRSEYAHAKIITLDTSVAEKVEGVRAVITSRDFPPATYGEAGIPDQILLASEKVLYYGQPVCVVAADTSDIAEDALSKIRVEYEELPVAFSAEDALREDSVVIHPKIQRRDQVEIRSKKNICTTTRIRKGNLKKAFAEADYFLEETFETQRVHQAYIEPRAATAFAQEDGKIVVWTSTQSPFLVRSGLSKILLLPLSRIQVVSTSIGGGFGGKVFPEIEALCVVLSKKSRRPVKIALTREEEFIAGNPRAGIRFWIKSAVKQGRIIARQARAIVDTGAFGSEGAIYANVAALQMVGPYSIDNVEIESTSVYTNKPPVGSYRAPGSVETAFAIESHTDSLARKGKMDPIEFRLRNLSEDGDLGPTGQILNGVGIKEALRKVADTINWKAWKTTISEGNHNSTSGQIKRGIGFACGLIPSVGIHASGAIIRMNEDGQIILETGAQDIGTGALMGLKMIAAEELGVTCDEIILRNGDTDSVPFDGGAQGSRTTYGAGSAVLLAAMDAKGQILRLASKILSIPTEKLFLAKGSVRVKDSTPSSKAIEFSDLARIASSQFGGPIIGRGSFVKDFPEYDKGCIDGYTLCPSFHDPAYVAHAAEVEVNLETGGVKVVRYIAAHDVGTAINPSALEGQIYGGVVQGIGYALLEKMQFDNSGLGSSLSFNEYKIPTLGDIPEIKTIIIEGHYGEAGPYGAKGVGEANIVPPAGAIANAVFDAIGLRTHELPITFEILKSNGDVHD
jgi:CO/xanthine dehydrogenase Mo-binding subunit